MLVEGERYEEAMIRSRYILRPCLRRSTLGYHLRTGNEVDPSWLRHTVTAIRSVLTGSLPYPSGNVAVL